MIDGRRVAVLMPHVADAVETIGPLRDLVFAAQVLNMPVPDVVALPTWWHDAALLVRRAELEADRARTHYRR